LDKKYQHIFFDLDKTLWDIYQNGKTSLEKMYTLFDLQSEGITDITRFIELYNKHNDYLWGLYRDKKIGKTALRSTRFKYTLRDFGIKKPPLTRKLSEYFYYNTPRGGLLMDNAKTVLEYLYKNYHLHIITNGFDDVQHLKLQHAGIDTYFKNLITSDAVGAAKPDAKIFTHALKIANATAQHSLMVGDDIKADCLGAKNFGMDQVFFNPSNCNHEYAFTFEITNLLQLKEIL